jgi:hypothetical protein
MLRKIVVILAMACMCFESAYANYPYGNVCPNPAGGNLNADQWGFYKCECTSYSAYKIDEELNGLTVGEIRFSNAYRQPTSGSHIDTHWSHGKNWNNAANRAGIDVDSTPIPGDIAYWESGNTDAQLYGHVAFVESVEYDDEMNWTKVYISEYNGENVYAHSTRSFTPNDTGWLNNPSGYIHILAHQECATSYYFNRMDASWSFPEQTREEWEKVFLLVWDQYRGETGSCESSSEYAFQQLWDAYGGLPGGFGGGSSGSGYDDDTDGDTWAGYAHHVGLKYMKVGKKSSGHWHGSRTWTMGEIPSKRDFRVKLKRKGGVWVDEACAEVWFSHNESFTSSDLYLKKKCKDLSDETEDERSIYIKDVHLPNMEAGKNYYFFTRVTYSGGINPSSDDDSDEYVKVEVVENPNSSEGSGASWDNFSDTKKAAIMTIIFD